MKKLLPITLLLLPLLAGAGPVDINTADASTLARELNGVGESRARAIVEFRDKNGRLASADDLLQVTGIGPQVLKLNRDNIRVAESQGADRPAGKKAALD